MSLIFLSLFSVASAAAQDVCEQVESKESCLLAMGCNWGISETGRGLCKMIADSDVTRPPPPPPVVPAVMFNQTFGSYMVLQRDNISAVYGTAPNGTTAVKITVSEASTLSTYSVDATLADGKWKALLKPAQAGGDYTITAVGTDCKNSTPAVLEHVTFGDVWYCAGQSNMWLPLHYSYHRNYTVANITAGKLSNIRLMAGDSQRSTFNPWMTAKQSIANSNVTAGDYDLFHFSAACWYFAEYLSHDMNKKVEQGLMDAPIPLGLINTAIGGSMIEEWQLNSTIATCNNASIGAHNQELWDNNVVPYLSMTVKGFLWYQGENNMHGVKGNSESHVGYGCQMVNLINLWRKQWSQVPGTTDPMAPFGLVALPGSGGEGGPNMGAMKWAQTGNYGILPNSDMPNTFLAQAYDLNDPWGDKTCYEIACCWNNWNETKCTEQLAKRGHGPTACQHYCSILHGTQVFMGGIHPRIKQPVGYRLGKAALANVYGMTDMPISGPTIEGCSSDSKTLTVKFDASILRGDTVYVQPYNATLSPFEVLTNMSDFCIEPVSVCTPWPNGTVPKLPCRGTSMIYVCSDTEHMLTQHIMGHGGNRFTSNWTNVPVMAGKEKNTVEIDLTKINGTVYAIRYAWEGSADCCMGNSIDVPCSIEQCPIMSMPTYLPANPFIAHVKNGKCKCVSPQKCDM